MGVWRDRVVIYMHAGERERLTPATVGTGEGGRLQRLGDRTSVMLAQRLACRGAVTDEQG